MSKKWHNFALVLNKRHEALHLHIYNNVKKIRIMVEIMCLLVVIAAFILYFVFLVKIDNALDKEYKDKMHTS